MMELLRGCACAARVCGCVLQCLDFWLILVRKTVSFGLILHIIFFPSSYNIVLRHEHSCGMAQYKSND